MTCKDFLTNLIKCRHFMVKLEEEFARVLRFDQHEAAVLMLDIDHFKWVNDCHGHATGDLLLKHFTEVVQSNLRKTDIAGCLGGEEFSIILPDTSISEATVFAERLCQDVTDNNFDAVLIRADNALYRAKETGRNRVGCCFENHSVLKK